jgi:comEA protein
MSATPGASTNSRHVNGVGIACPSTEEESMLRVCSSACLIVALVAVSALAQAPAKTKADATTQKSAPVINLNTASATELEQLPGIGAKVAARILEYRTKNGPFRKVEELMNVQGIGEKSFLKLRTQLTISGTAAATQQ